MDCKFRSVLYDSFHFIISCREKYYNMMNLKLSKYLLYKYINTIPVIMYPICPRWSEKIWKYGDSVGLKLTKEWKYCEYPTEYNKYRFYRDIIEIASNKIISERSKLEKKYNNKLKLKILITVELVKTFSDMELKLIKEVENYFIDNMNTKETWKIFTSHIFKKYGSESKKDYGKFISYVKSNIEKYGNIWIECVLDDYNKHVQHFQLWLPKFIKDDTNTYIFTVNDTNSEYEFNYGPGVPRIICENAKNNM